MKKCLPSLKFLTKTLPYRGKMDQQSRDVHDGGKGRAGDNGRVMKLPISYPYGVRSKLWTFFRYFKSSHA